MVLSRRQHFDDVMSSKGPADLTPLLNLDKVGEPEKEFKDSKNSGICMEEKEIIL